MSYTTLFFDLDDTLYPGSNGLWALIRERMGWYMVEVLGLPESEVPALRRKYYETYGTTLRGLQIHHQVDVDDYLHYVHDLPLEQFLQPNPELRALLLSLPQQRWIFTNADADHARRVMSVLGVQDCFTGIIDIRAIGFSTVWVSQNGAAKIGAAHSAAQYTLSGLLELPLKMPSLWAEETGNKMPAPRTTDSP
jgi:pyrimidine 5'-nucleotidase